MKQPNFKKAETHYEFVLGPIKIKDGLFMGDELAAKDIEFIISNKVTHIINTVSKVIPNLWQRFGIQYLSVNWTEKEQNIFDKKNNAVNAIFSFVQQAMQQGESCLIHSLHGKSRSCSVMVAYMMKKYNWTLDRCLEFIKSKKQHLLIRDNYMSQLQELEKRMMQTNVLSNDWNNCKNQQELIMKNTYVNSKKIPFVLKVSPSKNKNRVTWQEKPTTAIKPNNLGTTISGGLSATMNRYSDPKQKKSNKNLKSILKGQPNPYYEKDQNIEQNKMLATTDNFPLKKDNNFISSINGNVVHVTVNNFINTDKKSEDKPHLNRPYSSDNKQRIDRSQKYQPKKNLFMYQNSQKSPYQSKIGTKIGLTTKLTKKKQDIKNPIMGYQRPQSANIAAQRRKMKNITPSYMEKRDQLIITGKKRYPSTNPREEGYKWK